MRITKAHTSLCILVSVFVIHCQDSIIPTCIVVVSTQNKNHRLLPASVAEHLSDRTTLKTGFLMTRLICPAFTFDKTSSSTKYLSYEMHYLRLLVVEDRLIIYNNMEFTLLPC